MAGLVPSSTTMTSTKTSPADSIKAWMEVGSVGMGFFSPVWRRKEPKNHPFFSKRNVIWSNISIYFGFQKCEFFAFCVSVCLCETPCFWWLFQVFSQANHQPAGWVAAVAYISPTVCLAFLSRWFSGWDPFGGIWAKRSLEATQFGINQDNYPN